MIDVLGNKQLRNHAYHLYYVKERLQTPTYSLISSFCSTSHTDECFHPKISNSSSLHLPQPHPRLSMLLSPWTSLPDHAADKIDRDRKEPETCTLSPCDLTLLARWCATTYQSLASDGRDAEIWRSLIVQEAMRYPPLLDGILALSALEMLGDCERDNAQEHKQDEQQLRYLAMLHWDRARAWLDSQVKSARPELTHKDSNAMFALCNILIVFAFGHSQIPSFSSRESALEDFCDIFRQLRGSPEIVVPLIDQVQQGELASLVRPEEARHRLMPDTFTLAIHGLRKMNNGDAERSLDPGTNSRSTYSQAIDCLSSCLRYIAWSSRPGLIELSWLLEIPAGFVDLALNHQPIALSILAHYCVVMYHLRSQWWMGDLGMKLLKEIRQLLGRDRSGDIQWALDAVAIDGDGSAR
ncbi:hypothetical protein BP00DRAFT_499350 [Aspergillus indologenus CBS 114.80]|uniref:Zn(II)2Cys6 transcription factor n=1 Tax=Aspergillus indologenus CBS 114.80 TaxID=1450541 RepID=A0A2V5HP72_9EURO|nr:hypothetical protein BP00DRAFT_499350 [Aspergillus indologenus CBS 114.80]